MFRDKKKKSLRKMAAGYFKMIFCKKNPAKPQFLDFIRDG